MNVVLTGGKFNRIHSGHVWLLKKAKKLGDRLVVVLAHDAHNKRPYAIPAAKRKKLVQATGIPDKVVVGDRKDYFKVIEKFRPAIIVLGYDQKLPPNTEGKIKELRIKIVRLKKYRQYRTSKLVTP